MSVPDSNSAERATYGHCELSGFEDCPQPLSKPAARCELCTGCLDPEYHPAPEVKSADVTAGEIAYAAYCREVGGKSVNGEPLPTWEELNDDPGKARVVDGWHCAANAVIAAYQTHEVLSGKYGDKPVEILHPDTHRPPPTGNAPKRDVVLGIDL